ncbi:MAG: V-type ATP synthase subunit F [Candidatus Latescibacterota bacterium]
MLKVYVLGRRSDILPFRAVGAELLEIQDESEVGPALERFKSTTEPHMLMMSEDLVSSCTHEIAQFRENKMNILLPIPTITTEPGLRLAQIRSMVAKALGVDLLGRKDQPENGA